MPDPKIRIYEVGNKKASVDDFPMVVHLVRERERRAGRLRDCVKPKGYRERTARNMATLIRLSRHI